MILGTYCSELSQEQKDQKIIGVIVCSFGGFFFALEAVIFNKAKHVDNKALTHYLNVFSTVLFPICNLMPYRFMQWKVPTLYDYILLFFFGSFANVG